jgi:hypothetical protein
VPTANKQFPLTVVPTANKQFQLKFVPTANKQFQLTFVPTANKQFQLALLHESPALYKACLSRFVVPLTHDVHHVYSHAATSNISVPRQSKPHTDKTHQKSTNAQEQSQTADSSITALLMAKSGRSPPIIATSPTTPLLL